MKKAIIYIHGKGGTAEESKHYQTLFDETDIIGFDYQAQTPWEAQKEFPQFFDLVYAKYKKVFVIANSIGAFFVMNALQDKPIEKAFFISPIVDMEKLITDMMIWENVSEQELYERKEIKTSFKETLSWDYLCFVRENPIKWTIPTCILYGRKDHMTSYATLSNFANKIGASLTIMENGEHWFHTDEQMNFLDNWIKQSI